jgi:hypothetical protein
VEFEGAPFTPVDARWSASQQPIRVTIAPDGSVSATYDETLVLASRELNLAPSSDGQEVAIAIINQDGSAHAFSAWSYRFMNDFWRDPQLALTQGTTYRVKVTATWAGESKVKTLELPYLSGNFNQFSMRKISD